MSSLFIDQDIKQEGPDVEVLGLAYDSRAVKNGFLFAALKGSQGDGKAHVNDAVARGAVAVLSADPIAQPGVTNILAKHPRKALALAANNFYARPDQKLKMIGITGTNGKTTVAHLVEGILEAAGLAPGVIGTLGARYLNKTIETGLTTPQSVDLSSMLSQMTTEGVASVVMEVSSHALEQDRVGGVQYDVGVFTNLTQDHLDYHGSMNAYFDAKSILINERLKQNGAAVLNLDDPTIAGLNVEGVWGFSVKGHPQARIVAEQIEMGRDDTRVQVSIDGHSLNIHSRMVGGFNVENILAAAGVGAALGFSHDVIRQGIESVDAVPGRLERVNQVGEPLVVVDYAHTPDALEKALTAVREITNGNVFCVFGCGGDRDTEKREPMGQAVGLGADSAVVTNDNPRGESPEAIAEMIRPGLVTSGMASGHLGNLKEYEIELDRSLAIGKAVRAAGPNDAVLIAGKGHEDYQITGDEKRYFDDREEARSALKARE
ncbi:MAG: UDP-N-acetylmuramoyl-L-alanyl-D-glutamate--2,6-diaminopimelate ligase [Deltaproteobacteria bacterium]|nr:UDP-N-acetylmuramoyl-L-alanyl-D-glutamate--2,6-diaminopimelate ligase [Deltaproteobacteria bacterium]MBT6433558.1 UDP-N-acetylmuramoyl-L-alanyl-D-glutamate--2,6-diaminopimelate ligase [Deltaproteobacteria bacterium]MBT6490077.1 UDP-N-acetylmuramoyl-L-alanyl-D-glutamate--2,6-diaminopimelate ligase [Deltaproteobacteria bacterium]